MLSVATQRCAGAWGWGATSGLWDTRGGRLVGGRGEEAFDLRWEVCVWTPREAGAGDTDLDSGHIEVTAGRAGMAGLSE